MNLATDRATAPNAWRFATALLGFTIMPNAVDRGTAGKAKSGPANWTRRTPRQSAKDNTRG